MALTLKQDFTQSTLATAAKVGPTLTFARSSSATYFDSSGTLQTASSGTARLAAHTYNGTSWVNRGVLIEEARTNLLLDSNDPTTANWIDGFGGPTITGSQTNELTGNSDAFLVERVDGNNDFRAQTFSCSTSTSYVVSVHVKEADGDRFRIQMWKSPNVHANIYWDWTSGVPTYDADASTDWLINDQGYEQLGANWYRVWFTYTSHSSDTDVRLDFYPETTGSGTEGLYVFGFQVEQAAFPTSYIPTTTATVTRSADDLDTTTLSWLDTAATAVGTFVVEAQFPWASTAAYPLIQLDDNVDTNDRIYIERDASENINFKTVHASDTDGDCSPTDVISEATQFEVAAAYADDDIATSTDGATVTTDATAALPLGTNPVAFHVGNDLTNYWNGYIKHLRYYDERLANAILENPPPFDARPMLMLMGVGR